jgi:recombinational DNA repair protein (RecF pathway)
MRKKLSTDEAVKVMKAAKLKPLENYPGNKTKWKCKCLRCGKTVYPSFGSVKNGQGGCKNCGIKISADLRRNSEKDVVTIMKNAGALPLEPYSNSKKPWLCRCLKCKKEITPTFGNVRNGNKPCAYCSKKKVHPGDAIKIMRKAGLEPLVPYPGSNTKWKCKHLKCGKIVYPMYSWIVAGSGGCQKCGYIVSGLKGRVSEKLAIQIMKKAGLTPLTPYLGAGKPWKSKCSRCKQIISPTYNRIASGTGCGVCAGKIVIPEMAVKLMKKANLEPLVPYPGGRTNWKCRCMKCGEFVYPNYGDIQQGDGGCKYCSGHYVSAEDAEKVMLAANIKPLVPYVHSGIKWESECLVCHKKIFPRYNTVKSQGGGCRYCARKYLDSEDAIKLMRKAKLEPLVPYPGSQKPWRCKCLRCGHEVNPAYTSVQGGQKGCIYCGGKKVDPQEAFNFMVSKGLKPLKKYKRADGPWKCRCMKCLKIVTPAYSAVSQGQGGCRYCTNKGLDYNSPAFLYLMTHQEFRAHKVGVGNHKTRNNRIKEHTKTGWILINSKDFATGNDAFNVEQKTLIWLRRTKSLSIYLSKTEMPQGGETETVDAAEIDLPTIWAKVEELSKKSIKKR